MTTAWNVEPGARVTRADVRRTFGGGSQGGILPSASTPNVLVYSDPAKGRLYGYDYDGWDDDDDLFLYTGEGQLGDQKLTSGNLALANHRADGRSLRVFVAVDKVPGSDTLIHEYIGEFAVDSARPYLRAEAPDREMQPRSVFVFRMRPVGSAVRRVEDHSSSGDAPTVARTASIDLEAHRTSEYATAGSDPQIAQRRESDLTTAFHSYLGQRGHELGRLKIQPPGELRALFTDTYDKTTNILYEAKSAATRRAVREIVGQLLDYRRHIAHPGLRTCALLPSKPSDDLLDLIHSIGASCTWQGPGGTWPVSDPA